jgi:hypothetical protein
MMDQHPQIQVNLGVIEYFIRLVISKGHDFIDDGLPALEVSGPFFVQGYISLCGDAL